MAGFDEERSGQYVAVMAWQGATWFGAVWQSRYGRMWSVGSGLGLAVTAW